MSKRLEMLEKLASSAAPDSFALYGLAMEYRTVGRTEDAIRTFERLRAKDPEYLPMFLMAGQLLESAGQIPAARSWLEAGVALAERKGDQKAKNELSAALAACD